MRSLFEPVSEIASKSRLLARVRRAFWLWLELEAELDEFELAVEAAEEALEEEEEEEEDEAVPGWKRPPVSTRRPSAAERRFVLHKQAPILAGAG